MTKIGFAYIFPLICVNLVNSMWIQLSYWQLLKCTGLKLSLSGKIINEY